MGESREFDLREDIYPHINAEFFVWLLYRSEIGEDTEIIRSDDLGDIELIIQDRLSFRDPQQEKDRAVISGEDAPNSAETKAALVSGKTLQDVKLMLRMTQATYLLTLRGDHLDISGLKQLASEMDQIQVEDGDSREAMLLLRMQEYEDIWGVVGQLFREFVVERTKDSWYTETLQEMRKWVHELD